MGLPLYGTLIAFLLLMYSVSYAQTTPENLSEIPGSADSGRIGSRSNTLTQIPRGKQIGIPEIETDTSEVPGAKDIQFELNDVKIISGSVFSKEEMKSIYSSYLGKSITLDTIWTIAHSITQKYRDRGYFLSRAYIPEQEIDNGTVTINIVEGRIGEIVFAEKSKSSEHAIIDSLRQELLLRQPVRASDLEEFMLRLNTLTGLSYFGALQPYDDADSGQNAVKLLLTSEERGGKTLISANNYGSRFLGPYQANFVHEDYFLPLQRTILFGASSIPLNEFQYAGLGCVDICYAS